jgi:hypothetical protein
MNNEAKSDIGKKKDGRTAKLSISDKISDAANWYKINWANFVGKEADETTALPSRVVVAAKLMIGSFGSEVRNDSLAACWAFDVLRWDCRRQLISRKGDRASADKCLTEMWIVWMEAWESAVQSIANLTDLNHDANSLSDQYYAKLVDEKPSLTEVIETSLSRIETHENDYEYLPDDLRKYSNAWEKEKKLHSEIPWPPLLKPTVGDMILEIWDLPLTSRGRSEIMRHRLGFNAINFGSRTTLSFVFDPTKGEKLDDDIV